MALRDLVDEFEIELDLDNVSTLYDYATCQYINRTTDAAEPWPDFSQLGKIGKLQDENKIMQVKGNRRGEGLPLY